MKKNFRDRRDGKFCTDIQSMNQICIDLKPRRSLGELYVNQKFDVTNLVHYIEELKKEDKNSKVTYFHAFCTAIGMTMYNRPLLNRFVANRHVYEHNEISLAYVMKVAFDDKSKEIMSIMEIDKDDNIFSICKKTSDRVEKVRKHGETGEGANNAIDILAKLPNILRVPVVGLFKMFDRHGWLPASLVKDNLYYSSMIVTNIGRLHCDGIYHNVTDFGTCSGMIAMGEVKEEIVKENGKNVTKYFCEFGVTIDERIADGFYFIKSLKLIQHIFDNPELLEKKVSTKVKIDY